MRVLSPAARLATPLSPALVLGIVISALAIAILPLGVAFALVLGVAALLLTLVRLEVGLALLIFTVPFGSLGEVEMGEFSLSATEFIVPLVIIGWVMRMVAAHEAKITFPWIVWPLGLFLAAMLLSFTNALSIGLSLKEIAKWLEFLAVFILVGNVIKERWQVKFLLGAILAAGVLAGLHGWYQFVLKEGPGSFIVGGQFLRAFGFYGQPNPFAGYLLTVAPLALTLVLLTRADHRAGRLLRSALGVLCVALLMTLSRGGMIGLAVAASVIGAIRARASRPYLVLALLVALLSSLVISYDVLPLPGVDEGGPLAEFGIFDPRDVALTPQNWSVVERMALWHSAWKMWEDSPWLGIGIGNFRAVYPDYALPGWEFGQEHAHNYYLNVLTETGILGLFAYIMFLGSLLWYVLRSFRAAMERGWHLGSAVTLGVLAMLMALSLHNFFDNIYVHGMLVQMSILLGLMPFASDRGGFPAPHAGPGKGRLSQGMEDLGGNGTEQINAG